MLRSLFASRSGIGKAIKQARKLLGGGQGREASKLLAESIDEARSNPPEDDRELIEALVLRGSIESSRAHYQVAFDLYAEAVMRCEEGNMPFDRCCADAAMRAAQVYYHQIEGDCETVRRLTTTISEALVHLAVQSIQDFVALVDKYIHFMIQLRAFDQLQAVMLQAEKAIAQRCSDDKLLCGEMHLRLSRCWPINEEPDRVLEHAALAREILEEVGEEASELHLETIRRIAACHVRVGNRDRAREVLTEECRRLASVPTTDQRPRVECLARLAHVALRQEDLESAERAASDALALAATLRKVAAEGPRLATAALATVQALRKREQDALKTALGILNEIPEGEEDRVRALLPVCEALMVSGAFDSALKLTNEILVKLASGRPLLDEHLIDASLICTGALREKGKLGEAEDRVFELLERLDDENQLDSARHGRVLIELADLRTQQERYDDADEILSSAMYMVMEAGEIEGDLSGTVLNRMAYLNMKQGESETAGELFERSKEILTSRGAFGGRNQRLYSQFAESRAG